MGQFRSQRPTFRLFGIYALISLLPVLALGFALAASYRSEAVRRGIVEGRSEAVLVARTAVEPLLDGRSLNKGITADERIDLRRLVTRAISGKDILRMRLRDLSGQVVFSNDGSGFNEKPEDEALDAAHGSTVVLLTKLNSDSNDSGKVGPQSVEAYVPLANSTGGRIGVLEIYLPYAPIDADVTGGLNNLYRGLALGLGLLYLILFAISASVGRGLRRESARNRFLAEHDTLTDLPNRSLFHRRVEKPCVELPAIAFRWRSPSLTSIDSRRSTIRSGTSTAITFSPNSRIGCPPRLVRATPSRRLGGDEFGLILRNTVDVESALFRLRDVIDCEILVCGLPITVEASIGYVSVPDDGTDVDELLQRADVAMYLAKAQRAGVMRYDQEQDHYDATKLSSGRRATKRDRHRSADTSLSAEGKSR